MESMTRYESDLYRKFKRQKVLLLFTLPAIIGVLVFNYFPMYGIIVAFQEFDIVDGFWGSKFVGFKQFEKLFQSPEFLKYFLYTLKMAAVRLVIIFPIPIMFALLLNELTALRYKKFVQSVSYLPHFISWVVAAGMVYHMLGTDGGLTFIISRVFGRSPEFLTNPSFFPLLYGISLIWREMGYSAIVYLAALAGIDAELYEAAMMDGAGRWKLMQYVTLPSLVPTMAVLFILSVGSFLAVGFDPVWNLQNSIIRSDTHIMDTYVFVEGLRNGNYSFATAFGLFNSVIAILLITSSNFISKKLSDVGLW